MRLSFFLNLLILAAMTSTGSLPLCTARSAPRWTTPTFSTSRTSRQRRGSLWRHSMLQMLSNLGIKLALHFNNIYYCSILLVFIFIFNRWENKNSKEKASKEEVLGSYFNLLTDEEIKSLYKIYEDDFLNFGYKFAYRTLKLG